MATEVYTDHGLGQIVATETVRGIVSHKVEAHDGAWSTWVDDVDLRVADINPSSTVGDIGPDPGAVGMASATPTMDAPQAEAPTPSSSPSVSTAAYEPASPGDLSGSHWDNWRDTDPYDHGYDEDVEDLNDPAFRPGHEPDYAGQAQDFARSNEMQRRNQDWQDQVRGKERDQYGDLIEGSRHEGWAPVDRDHSVNLPYNPRPQYTAIPSDVESTIQPIHRIDPEERLRPADSISFEDRAESEGGPWPKPNPDLFAKSAGWQHSPEMGGYGGQGPAYSNGLEPDYHDAHSQWLEENPGQAEEDSPYFYSAGGGHEPEGWEGQDRKSYTDDQDRDSYTVDPHLGSYRRANPLLLLPLLEGAGAEAGAAGAAEGAAGAGAAEGGAEGGAGGLGMPKVPGMGGSGAPGGQGQGGGDHKADEVIDALSIGGPGWGNLVKARMIDSVHEADYHYNPIAQFAHDPVSFIERHASTYATDVSPETAHYGMLVEADAQIREAAWKDVRAKALRLRREGNVQVNDIAPDRIYATVKGDTGTYDVMIAKEGSFGGFGGGHQVSNWSCDCEWGKWAFQRRYSYVGRLCSHGYAAYLTMQSAHMTGKPRQEKLYRLPTKRRKRANWIEGTPGSADLNMPGSAHMVGPGGGTFMVYPGDSKDTSRWSVEHLHPGMNPDEETGTILHDDLPSSAAARAYVEQQLHHGYRTADTLQNVPQRLTPELVVNDTDDTQQMLDVTKDERDTTGPQDIMHFSMVMAACDRDSLPYPMELVAFLERYADDDKPADWKAHDFGEAIGDLDKVRELSDRPQSKDFGSMDERNDEVRDAVTDAREKGVDADQLVASRNFTADAAQDAVDAYTHGPGFTPTPSAQPAKPTPAPEVPSAGPGGGGSLSDVLSNPSAVSLNPGGGGAADARTPAERATPGAGFPQNPGGVSTNSPGYNPSAPAPGSPGQVTPPTPPTSSGSPGAVNGPNAGIPWTDNGSGSAPTPVGQRPTAPSAGGAGGGTQGAGAGKTFNPSTGGGFDPSAGGGWKPSSDTSKIAPSIDSYVVNPGDTLQGIADRAGVGVDTLKAPSGDANMIRPGDSISIPNRPGGRNDVPTTFTPGGGSVTGTSPSTPSSATPSGGPNPASPKSATPASPGGASGSPAKTVDIHSFRQQVLALAGFRTAADDDDAETTPAPTPDAGKTVTPAAPTTAKPTTPSTGTAPKAVSPTSTDVHKPGDPQNDPNDPTQSGVRTKNPPGALGTPGGGGGGMGDIGSALGGAMGDIIPSVASGVTQALPSVMQAVPGLAQGFGGLASGLASGLGHIFGSQEDIEDWKLAAFPGERDTLPHDRPFEGFGPAEPIAFTDSASYVDDNERSRFQDVTAQPGNGETNEKYRTSAAPGPDPSPGGGIRRKGGGPRTVIVPEVVREVVPKGQHTAAEIPDLPDPYSKTAADFADEDGGGQQMTAATADPNYDPVAAFQASPAAMEIMGNSGGGGRGSTEYDDIAAAASMHLQKTAGRKFSPAEEAALIREGDIGGAGNLDELDLTGTHYAAQNSVGLW